MKLFHGHPTLCLVIFLGWSSTCWAQAGSTDTNLTSVVSLPVLKVGMASVDITPTESVWLEGWWSRKSASTGVFEKIYATCLVFDNGSTRVGLMSIDVCILRGNLLSSIRTAAQKAGIPRSQMIVNFSHTHSAPDLSGEAGANNAAVRLALEKGATLEECSAKNKLYIKEFEKKTVDLVQSAVNNLAEAKLDYALGSCTMGISRRQVDETGKAVGMKAEPRKPIDIDVPVLRVLSPSGEVRAVLFSYACHPTVFTGDEVSSDFVGFARDWIDAAYPKCFPVFVQGCGGDIKPRAVRPGGQFGHSLLDVKQTCAEVGHELGRAVVAAVCVSPEPVVAAPGAPMPLMVTGEHVSLPLKVPSKSNAGIELSVLRIGNHYLIFGQREICVEIGLRIKRELAA